MYLILKRLYIVSYFIAAFLSLPTFCAAAVIQGESEMLFMNCVLGYLFLPWIIGVIYWVIKGRNVME